MFDDTTLIGQIWTATIIFDPLITSFILYLMIEHNNHKYLQFISILYQSKVCCCFNCLMKATLESLKNEKLKEYVENNSNQTKNNDMENTKDHTIKLEHTTYNHQSEMTKPVVDL